MRGVDIPFRVRVGVTGHRVLPAADGISRRVSEILSDRIWELFDRPPARKDRTASLAFTLLTCLAEGADRLLAREVLGTPAGAVEAVLPLGADEYARDFDSGESRKEFTELLEKASRVVVMELPSTSGSARSGVSDDARKEAYEKAGRHVVEGCDLLVAVWDGKPSRSRGGTAEIVAYARRKRVPLIIISSAAPHEISIEKGPGLNSQAYKRIRVFNEFPMARGAQKAYEDNVYRTLFQTEEGERLGGEAKEKIRNGLLPWYVRASLIAKKNQKGYRRAGLLVYSLSPLAVAAVAVALLRPDWAFPAYACEFLILAAILATLLLADGRKTHKKWIEARFLAELIRSAIFLSACGTKPATLVHLPNMRPHLEAGEWTIRAFDEIMERMGPVEPCKETGCAAAVGFVRRRWLRDQMEFHASKAAKSGRASRRLERFGWLIFLAAIFAAAWHLAAIFFGHPGILASLEKPMVFLAVVLPAMGAAVGGIRGHREHSRLAKRSQYMEAALAELDGRFDKAADFRTLQPLLHETERLILRETGEWLSLMKFAKLEAI